MISGNVKYFSTSKEMQLIFNVIETQLYPLWNVKLKTIWSYLFDL